MNLNLRDTHTYPLKKHWRLIGLIGGLWNWLILLLIIVFPFLLIFKWGRTVFPAFLRIMKGEPRSYLRVSESGLVYRLWPVGEMRCKWDDIKQIKSDRVLGAILHLHRAEQIGYPEIAIMQGPPEINLGSVIGWHKGNLKEVLQSHAPQLFGNQS